MEINILYLNPKKRSQIKFKKHMMTHLGNKMDTDVSVDYSHSLKGGDDALSSKKYDAIIAYTDYDDGSFLDLLDHKDPGVPIILIADEKIDADTLGKYNIDYCLSEGFVDEDPYNLCSIISNLAKGERNDKEIKELKDRLSAREHRLDVMRKTGKKINGISNTDAIYLDFYGIVKKEMPCDAMTISSYSNEKKKIKCEYAIHNGESVDIRKLPVLDLDETGKGPQSKAIMSGKPLVMNDLPIPKGKKPTKRKKYIQSSIYVPLVSDDEVIGVLYISSYRKNDYTKRDMTLLNEMAQQFQTSLENARTFKDVTYSEGRYTSLFENAPVSYILLDGHGILTQANNKWLEILGYAKNELVGKKFDVFLSPASKREFKKCLFKLKTEGNVNDYELEVMKKDGDTILLSMEAKRLFDGDNIIIYCVLRNITDLKGVEEKLRLTQHSMDMANFLIFWIDPEGNFIYVNDSVSDILGYSKEELLHMSVHDIDPYYPYGKRREHWNDLREEKLIVFESTHIKKNGDQYPVLICDQYIEFGGREYEFAYVTDISDIKEKEREMMNYQVVLERELNARIKEIEDSKDELSSFAGHIARNVRENLMVSLLNLKMIKRKHGKEIGPEPMKLLKKSLEATANIESFTQDLLEFSAIGKSDEVFVPFNALESIEAAINNLKGAIEKKKAKISVRKMPEIFAKRSLITLLFENLISNSINFSGERFPKITISYDELESGHIFYVKDNGVGIPERYLEKAFEAFWTADEGADSKGMGLALCKSIVEHHGGRIWAESKVGKGSVFQFTIPFLLEDDS